MSSEIKFIALYKNDNNFVINTKYEKKIQRRSIFIGNDNPKNNKNKKIKKLKHLKNKSCELILEDKIMTIKFENNLGFIKIESQLDGISLIIKTPKVNIIDKILK